MNKNTGVAQGAAILAAILRSNYAREVVLQDVTSISLAFKTDNGDI